MAEEVLILKDKWDQMTITELIDQRSILYDRYDYLVSIDAKYAAHIQEGINQIDKLITDKLNIPNVF